MALANRYDLSQHPVFQNRVRQAMTDLAVTIATENNTGIALPPRKSFAQRFLRNPQEEALPFVQVVVTNAAINAAVAALSGDPANAAVTDAMIVTAVGVLWNGYADAFAD